MQFDITREVEQLGKAVVLVKTNGESVRREENRRPSSDQLEYPSAPRMLTKALLPSIGDGDGHNRDIATPDAPRLLPDFLLFQDEALPMVDARINFQERNRCVAQPTMTFMPEYPGYLWGAVSSHVTARDGMRVHFEEITEPATNPAVFKMKIAITFGGVTNWLDIERRPYIAVVDIQRAVIGWMKGARYKRSSVAGNIPKLSTWAGLTDEDGREVELEVWVWRGLKPLDNSLEKWELQFANDVVDC